MRAHDGDYGMNGSLEPPTFEVVRGFYNSMTPYYKWHRIETVEDYAVITACELRYDETQIGNIEPFDSWVAKLGERCQTNACGMKGT